MVRTLVGLCAREVVSDHSSSPCWLRWVPRELYAALLEAAFSGCRPLAVGELVQRWPERSLRVGGGRRRGQAHPNRLCVQALLLAVVRGLTDQRWAVDLLCLDHHLWTFTDPFLHPRFALRVLDLCGLQGDEGSMVDSMGGWSLTVALCTMVVQARAGAQRADGERKRFSARKDVTRERGQRKRESEGANTNSSAVVISDSPKTSSLSEEEVTKGVRRRMEMERRRDGTAPSEAGSTKDREGGAADSGVLVCVRADFSVNARSWERVCVALNASGPLKLQCRYLRVEEISVSSIKSLLDLLPHQGLLGLEVRYSSLGVSGLVQLLPLLSTFPALKSLCLHYCNLDLRGDQPGQEEALRGLSQGLAQLKELRRLSLTALRLPGQLRVLLR